MLPKMSLFPAYAKDTSEYREEHEGSTYVQDVTSSWEAALLASEPSDNDEEREERRSSRPLPVTTQDANASEQHFYFDHKLDFGNMRVSTIYYPGRPQYASAPARCALGLRASARRERRVGESRRARYHAAPGAAPPPPDHAELAARTAAYHHLLADKPHDQQMWINFIHFQEQCRDSEAALSVCERACKRVPESRRLRAELHRVRCAALPPLRRLQLLRAELGGALQGERLLEAWLRVVAAAGAAGGAEAYSAAAAAAHATRALPAALPHVVYCYGVGLRAAGHWERLVLLLELLMAMNFPPAAFPPHTDPLRLALQEQNLQNLEDKVVDSGLPLSVVWTRVERARGAAHWRGVAGGAGAGPAADPLRAPQPADVAELLLPAHPAAAHLLLLTALRLAKVPVLPCSQYMVACCDAANSALGDEGAAECGEALLGLVRAARRLHAAHPARPPPGAAPRVLKALLDPPHYFSDDTGYLGWVGALWEAACGWAAGAHRTALVCWRLRWLHALVLAGEDAEEARRVVREGRGVLKRWAGHSALPYAQWARLQGAAGDARGARSAALHALTHALAHPHHTVTQRLYVARVAGEVCDVGGEHCGAWGTVCAALGRPLPAHDALQHPPPPDLLQHALIQCESQCSELEREYESSARVAGDASCDPLDVMLAGPGEWAAARVRLASPARRDQLLASLLHAAQHYTEGLGGVYGEQGACALVVEAARQHRQPHVARRLLALYPHNALIALACSGAALWAWERDMSGAERLRALWAAARSHVAALCSVVPALVRAAEGWEAVAAARLAAACARAGRRGAGGALLHAARLEAEARAPTPRTRPALLAALEAHPHTKWLAVRGAAWCPSEASALHDVLLERGLRVHALLDELMPLLHHSS